MTRTIPFIMCGLFALPCYADGINGASEAGTVSVTIENVLTCTDDGCPEEAQAVEVVDGEWVY